MSDIQFKSQSDVLVLVDDHFFRGAAIASALTDHKQALGAEVRYHGEYDQDDRRLNAALKHERVSACIHSIGGRSIAEPEVIETLRQLMTRVGGGLPVIVLTDEVSQESLSMAVAIGLNGVVPTNMSCEVCVAAIRFIIVGGQYLPHPTGTTNIRQALSMNKTSSECLNLPSVSAESDEKTHAQSAQQTIQDFASSTIDEVDQESEVEIQTGDGISRLTKRQLEVMHLLERGLSNKRIGLELDLSESTVKLHVRHLLRKLNVDNRTQIALLASSILAKPSENSLSVVR